VDRAADFWAAFSEELAGFPRNACMIQLNIIYHSRQANSIVKVQYFSIGLVTLAIVKLTVAFAMLLAMLMVAENSH